VAANGSEPALEPMETDEPPATNGSTVPMPAPVESSAEPE
jgi:hypothetical protein